jgi:hypothetical protein
MPLYACCNVFVGDLDIGLQTFMRALEVSRAAFMTYEYLDGISLAHLLKRDFEGAAQWALRSIAVNAQWPASWWNLAPPTDILAGRSKPRRNQASPAYGPNSPLSHFERIQSRYESRYSLFVEGIRKAGLLA